MTRNEVLSIADQTILCLESCVEDYLGRNEPLLAECCEDALRACKAHRAYVFQGLGDEARRGVPETKVWVAIVPDNDLLGVYSTANGCWKAICDNPKTQGWSISPEEAVIGD